MRENERLRIAIQKSGRLSERSLSLFKKCGLDFDLESGKDRLFHQCLDFPIDLMLVRDDDIPKYVADGICDLGVVGENVLAEGPSEFQVLHRLGFGQCRLSLAVPEGREFKGVRDLAGKRIATSYPSCLKKYLTRHEMDAHIVILSGSVEIAPKLGIADAVCDLVSTGGTLKSNGLKEVDTLFESQAVLIRASSMAATPFRTDFEKNKDINRLLQRIKGVLQAAQSKYIMMNAPSEALSQICKIIPGMEEPSVMPLGLDGRRVAIHAVAREAIFWETIERLKEVGASSILVLPIEKVIS